MKRMATWGDGNMYPGTNTPGWWYSTTATTSTTWPTTIYMQHPPVAGAALAKATQRSTPPRPKTAVEWLRSRVQEMCDLAELGAAA